MTKIRTVGELKAFLLNLPDNMPVDTANSVHVSTKHERTFSNNAKYYDPCYTKSENNGSTYGCCRQAGLDNTTFKDVLSIFK